VFRFYAKGTGAAAGDDGDWQDAPAPSRVSPPAWGGLTDYSGENKAGPVTNEVQKQEVGDQDLSQTRANRADANGFTGDPGIFGIGARSPVQQQLEHDVMPSANPTPEEGGRGLASMAAGGIAGIYAGQIPRLAAMAQEGGLGARMASGAAQGAVSAVASDPTPDRNHQIANLILGGGLGAMGMAGRAPRESAFVPGTQAAVDEASLAARGLEPTLMPGGVREAPPTLQGAPYERGSHSRRQGPVEGIPNRGEGNMGNQAAAAELEALLNNRMEQRGQANNEMIGADQKAMAQEFHRVHPGEAIDTDPALIEIARIRQQQMGPHQPFMPEQDARLAEAQKNLLRDPNDIQSSEMSPEDAQKLWHALNYRIKNAQPGDMGTAGDRQAAGVVADMVQNADPRKGPYAGGLSKLEDTSTRYGQEKDALATLSDLLYRSDSGKPADRVGQQAAGIQRLGNAGATSEKGTVGQANEQQNLRQIEQVEPASSPLMAEIRARRTKERREIGLRGGVSVAGAVARSTIGNASNMLFRGQGGGVPGTTPDQLILTIEELRKYNEMRRKQQEGQQ
jgi:hypothetical protein